MLTRADIEMAYRLFLGREPESEEAVQGFQSLGSIDELRQTFLRSEEFQMIAAPFRETFNRQLLLDSSMSVKVDASTRDTERILKHIRRTWQELGESDPYWSVLSSDQFKKGTFFEHEDEFYFSAETDIQVMRAFLDRANRALPSSGRCFEFGCGVGRITLQLAQEFSSVVGYDISTAHLKLAEDRARHLGVQNVTFQGPLDDLRLSKLGKFDFIFSIIVLQHNPPPVMQTLISEFCKMLNPGGMAYFQVPTYQSKYYFDPKSYFSGGERSEEIEMHAIPQAFVFDAIYEHGCRVLEVREDNLVGIPNFISNSFLIEKKA